MIAERETKAKLHTLLTGSFDPGHIRLRVPGRVLKAHVLDHKGGSKTYFPAYVALQGQISPFGAQDRLPDLRLQTH